VEGSAAESDDAVVVELVRCARQGDAKAFTALIAKTERLVLAVALAVSGDGQIAGDLAQEAFLRAWQKLGDLQDPARFAGWICGIVRRLAIDFRRRQRPPIEQTRRSLPQAPDAPLQQREQCQQIAAALEQLDEVSRCVVMLRYYDDLSSRQIGQMLDLSAAAVDMRLSRAKRELRQTLSFLSQDWLGSEMPREE
jgi:RNA polymerase sigma factor (sigma-70 family)